MKALALQDMRNNMGLCFIDAKGSETEDLLDWVPKHRRDDVIYLDLETSIPLDAMACKSYKEVMQLVSDIAQIFNRLCKDDLGSRMHALMLHTVLALHLRGKSAFLDIYKMITDESFRDAVVDDPNVKANEDLYKFWTSGQAEKIIASESGIGLAFTRLSQLALSPSFKKILGNRDALLNFENVIADRRIVLVKLEQNSSEALVYGSLLVSKIEQAIARRPKPYWPPFALYIDEFHIFVPDGFDKSISYVGGIGPCLSHARQSIYHSTQNDWSTRRGSRPHFNVSHFSNRRTELRKAIQPAEGTASPRTERLPRPDQRTKIRNQVA